MSALHRGGTTINHCFEEAFVISVVTYREMVDHQSPNDRMHVFYQDMDPHLRNFHTGCIAWTGPDEMAEDLDGRHKVIIDAGSQVRFVHWQSTSITLIAAACLETLDLLFSGFCISGFSKFSIRAVSAQD